MTTDPPIVEHAAAAPPRRSRSLVQAMPYVVLAAALIFLGYSTLSIIAKPGLQHDEMLFINAALGGDWPWREFILAKVDGVPTMLMPYIGALKAWLYWPVFAIFGVSPSTIRGPMVVAAMLAIAGTFWLVRRQLGPWYGAALAVLLASDPAYMTMAKADWGPIALASLLRVVALLAYFAWIRTRSARYLWLIFAALLAGVFNKTDFLSFVAALLATAAIVHHRDVWTAFRARRAAASAACTAFAAMMLLLYVEIIGPARSLPVYRSKTGFPDRLMEVWNLLISMHNGSALHGYMTGLPVAHTTLFAAIFAPSAIVAGACAIWYGAARRGAVLSAHPHLAHCLRLTTFFFTLFAVMAAILTATPQVAGAHHIVALWPLPATLSVCVLAVAFALPHRQLARATGAIAAVSLALLVGSQLRTSAEFRSDFASDRHWTPIWTTEIYALASAVERAAPSVDSIVTTDWGFGTQVFALTGDAARRRFVGGWDNFVFADEATRMSMVNSIFRNRATLVLCHRRGHDIFPHTTERWQRVLQAVHPRRGVSVVWAGAYDAAVIVDDRG